MEERSFLKPGISLAMLIAGIVMAHANVGWFAGGAPRIAWYIVAFLPVGLGVMKEAWECAMKGDVFSEFMLMSVASIGAFAIGEYPEAVAVMLFYCIGETLQDMAVDRARDNIKSLMEFRRFIEQQHLNDPDTLLLLNENSDRNLKQVVSGFTDITRRITAYADGPEPLTIESSETMSSEGAIDDEAESLPEENL